MKNFNLECFALSSIEELEAEVSKRVAGKADVFTHNNVLYVQYNEMNYATYSISENKIGELVLSTISRVWDGNITTAGSKEQLMI